MTPTEVLFRPGDSGDLPAVAEVFLASRKSAPPHMPPLVHPDDDVRHLFAGLTLAPRSREMWVAQSGAEIIAYAKVKHDWLDDLYVHPDHTGHGIGSALLDLVKQSRPQGFCLWVFESNQPAREFYARHQLVELERTDGSGNEQGAPDIRLAWPGADPLAFFRGLIDEVDDDLGQLLARRTALTRAVQDHKRATLAVADPGRDTEREAAVVRRVAAHVPHLGPERVNRILQAIITESIDAAAL